MGLALGIRHVQGLFMLPMTMDRGWSRESFAFALAIQNLALGFAQPAAGMLSDRFGGTKVIAGGTLLYGFGLTLMSLATTPMQLYLGCGVVVGVALSCTAFGVVYAALSRLSPAADRGWTMGLAGAIGGLGQFVAVPATQALQDSLGWQWTLLALGGGMVALVVLAPQLRDKGATEASGGRPSQTMGETIRQALKHRGFWLLNLGFLACGFQLAFIASHLPAYLLDMGVSAQIAVVGLAVIALTNIVGNFVCARLGDLYRRKNLLALVYLIRTGAMALFLLLPVSTTSVILFCGIMGLLWLGTVPLTNGLLSQVFGVQYIGSLFGFVFLGHQIGAFLGVWLGGYVFDTTQSYDLVWLVAMMLGLIAAVLHLPIDDRAVLPAKDQKQA